MKVQNVLSIEGVKSVERRPAFDGDKHPQYTVQVKDGYGIPFLEGHPITFFARNSVKDCYETAKRIVKIKGDI